MCSGTRRRVYHVAMAKGDFSSLKIDSFGKGINLVDPVEEMDVGYLGPLSRNVQPVGDGKSLQHSSGIVSTLALATSSTKRPVEFTKYSAGLIVGFNDGTVDRIVQATGASTNIGVADASGIPAVVVSQDSALNTYFAYIIRPTGSGVASTKVNLSTGVSVAWSVNGHGPCAISWKTMLIWASGTRVLFSKQGDPDTWPANNFIDIKTLDDALDDVVGFQILGEDLIVFKRRSTWVVFDPVTFDNRRLFSVGLNNRKCTTRLDDRIYWLSLEGIYSTDGEQLKLETSKLGRMNTVCSPDFYSTMVATPNGTIVASDSGGLLVGYSQFRDINGNMPWYSCRDTGYAKIRALTWASSDFSGASGSSDTPSSNALLIGAWGSVGTNSNTLGVSLDVTGAAHTSGGSSAHEDGTAVKSIVQLPTFHNSDVEGLSRLRRLNLYGHGSLGTTGVAAVEVYADNAGAPTFSQVGTAFVKEFIRYRPETKGKNFAVIIRSDGDIDFVLHTVEAQFRQAGR
jgi:hypothetical protein